MVQELPIWDMTLAKTREDFHPRRLESTAKHKTVVTYLFGKQVSKVGFSSKITTINGNTWDGSKPREDFHPRRLESTAKHETVVTYLFGKQVSKVGFSPKTATIHGRTWDGSKDYPTGKYRKNPGSDYSVFSHCRNPHQIFPEVTYLGRMET
ncbi:hypothetical protein GMOD_00009317 [Pyrenophora seminiperda CCB06]|uniref:Uncharacterized protein n=1 Tax=Pyrenophora seminiperda CCB06 TaxID=1302712 RepID=A0A3M7MBR8_9PLEO|nr:hypothetical protein GMOD_00009317 [Pyrenophora seminiperda CCB06]